MAAVRIGEFVEGKWGYIDKQGTLVIQPQFDTAGPFRNGLAVVANDRKFGYIDKTGKIVIPLQFASAGSFSEGLASVRIGDYMAGKDGYIDEQGKIVIEPQFDSAFPFNGGLADVRIGDKYGFIDKTGKIVIPPQFDFAELIFFGARSRAGRRRRDRQIRLRRHARQNGDRAAIRVRGPIFGVGWIGGGANGYGRKRQVRIYRPVGLLWEGHGAEEHIARSRRVLPVQLGVACG